MIKKGEIAGVVSLDQLDGRYVISIEQSRIAGRFIAEISWPRVILRRASGFQSVQDRGIHSSFFLIN